MVFLPEFSTKLKQLRTQRKLTQTDLGNMLGVSKSVISSYENSSHYPPYDILLGLSRIFGVSTDYLLGAEKHRMISVDGLTDTQVEAILSIIEELQSIRNVE